MSRIIEIPAKPAEPARRIAVPDCPFCGTEVTGYESAIWHPTYLVPCLHFIGAVRVFENEDRTERWFELDPASWKGGEDHRYRSHEWERHRKALLR